MLNAIALAQLLILVGQSNAYGFQVPAADAPTYYVVTDKVQIFSRQTRRFETMRPGVNTNNVSTNWGPEVEYAHWFHAERPTETLYIFKNVEGDSGLAPDSANADWSPRSLADIFDRATTRLTLAKADINGRGEVLDSTLIAMVQGETDGKTAAASQAYAANLRQFAEEARKAWACPNTPILVGRINGPDVPFRDAVRSAQATFAKQDGHAALVDTDAFPLQPDRLHLNAAGQIQLGAAFYAAARAIEVKPGVSTVCRSRGAAAN